MYIDICGLYIYIHIYIHIYTHTTTIQRLERKIRLWFLAPAKLRIAALHSVRAVNLRPHEVVVVILGRPSLDLGVRA